MLHHAFNKDIGILLITPDGPQEKSDFASVAQSVDAYIAQEGQLNGLMISVESFPGWKDFAAFTAHLRFAGSHEEHIARVAVVSDDDALMMLPEIANQFGRAELQHFPLVQREAALKWLVDCMEWRHRRKPSLMALA